MCDASLIFNFIEILLYFKRKIIESGYFSLDVRSFLPYKPDFEDDFWFDISWMLCIQCEERMTNLIYPLIGSAVILLKS